MMRSARLLCVWATFIAPTNGFLPTVTKHVSPVAAKKNSLYPRTSLSAIAVDQDKELLDPEDRFKRTASKDPTVKSPCIIQIDGMSYNLTAWAKAHPGGDKILKKFHDKDATKAFYAAGHSQRAIDMLKDFAIETPASATTTIGANATSAVAMPTAGNTQVRQKPRWRIKLFTKEDPIGIHKYMGIFVLLHFAFRFSQLFFGDPSAGWGSRLGKGASILPALCLIPHAVLSLSSLIFHTVPRERVVGMPMIWSEFRLHNIAFGLRAVVATALCWASYYFGHTPGIRRVAVWGSCAAVLAAQVAADLGTKYLRVDSTESTTATMPYWEGCSVETQKRFKSFYAYCQFMATFGGLACVNPAWPFSTLLAIQMASLLMTLVRKGLLTARGYHIGYTIALVMPWFMGARNMVTHGLDFGLAAVASWTLFQLRRKGVNKYALWLPVIAARILWGDRFLNWAAY